MGLSRVVQLKGKLICFVYFAISLISIFLIVSAVSDDFVSNKTIMVDYTLIVFHVSLVSVLAYTTHGDKENRWILAYLVVGFCDILAKKVIEEETEQQGYYNLICYVTIFFLMQVALFKDNDPTGFTLGAIIGFFFRLFITFVLGGWNLRSDEATHAAAVAAVAILAKLTETPYEPK